MISLSSIALAMFAQAIYVSVDGTDANVGDRTSPVRTLVAARDRARSRGIHRIAIEPGEYPLKESLVLGPEDSGLTIESATPRGALISGSVTIPESAIRPCNDSKVLAEVGEAGIRLRQVNLEKLGVKDIPLRPGRGFPFGAGPSADELFFAQTPLNIVRWPKQGYVKVTDVLEPGKTEADPNNPKPPRFSIGDRAKRWVQEPDAWIYGYFKFDWADESIPVTSIDPATGVITLAHGHVFGVDKGANVQAENVLSELSDPGEYYVDRAKQMLYFIPPSTSQPGAYRLSTLAEPLINVKGAANVIICGIDFAYSRGDGLAFNDCQTSLAEACRFYCLGSRGVTVGGGRATGVRDCDIWFTGQGGVTLDGGDRKTLTHAALFVENCDIHHYQRLAQTYRPAVSIGGCGNIVRGCRLTDAPHSAIIFGGNDHLIQRNEIARTLALTGDGGAIYTGRDWSARGTIIEDNYLHDNVGMRKWEPAIYLDDQASGITVRRNLIERCHWGFLIGGGRDNVIEANEIKDCDLGFHLDARGLGWAAKARSTLEERLLNLPYQTEPWKSAYPKLPNILNEDPMAPVGNLVSHNLLINSGQVLQACEEPFKRLSKIESNEVIPDSRKLSRGAMGHMQSTLGAASPASTALRDSPGRKRLHRPFF